MIWVWFPLTMCCYTQTFQDPFKLIWGRIIFKNSIICWLTNDKKHVLFWLHHCRHYCGLQKNCFLNFVHPGGNFITSWKRCRVGGSDAQTRIKLFPVEAGEPSPSPGQDSRNCWPKLCSCKICRPLVGAITEVNPKCKRSNVNTRCAPYCQ